MEKKHSKKTFPARLEDFHNLFRRSSDSESYVNESEHSLSSKRTDTVISKKNENSCPLSNGNIPLTSSLPSTMPTGSNKKSVPKPPMKLHSSAPVAISRFQALKLSCPPVNTMKAILAKRHEEAQSVTPLEERRVSRRVRNTVIHKKPTGAKALGYMGLRSACSIPGSIQEEGSFNKLESSISPVILDSLNCDHMCDLEIISHDKVPVRAPSYLLACHSKVLQEMFYPKIDVIGTDEVEEQIASVPTNPVYTPSNPRKVELAFAGEDAIRAFIHYCATRTLPIGMDKETSEANARAIHQCCLIARLFKIPSLMDEAFRTLRRLMNKKPLLVCAAFDEFNILKNRANQEGGWGFKSDADYDEKPYDEIRRYTLEYMRESPVMVLLGGGVALLSPLSIEAVIRDQFMDVDEVTMFHILADWVKSASGAKADNINVGKSLVPHIKLALIDTEYLNNQVKRCGFVEMEDIKDALDEIKFLLANQSIDDKERVVVDGAGDPNVDGVYIRMDGDIGLGDEEAVFIKEALDDELGPDLGLYLWNGKWAISSCVDYSNILYSCEVLNADAKIGSRHIPPKQGWEHVSGCDPPPLCTWKPSIEEEKSMSAGGRLAPTLDELKGDGLKSSIMSNLDNSDYSEPRELSLQDMMNLPIDDEFDCDAYKSINGFMSVRDFTFNS